MQSNTQKTALTVAVVGIIVMCAALWWGIFNRNKLAPEQVPTPVAGQNPSVAKSPILYPDPPALAGHVLVGPKVPTKFYLARNGKRYVFPDETKTYDTWKSVLPPIDKISQDDLESFPLGGNVWYRPATRLIRIETDSHMYAVSHGGVLRAINEGTAQQIFGKDWKSLLDTLQDYYYTNYNMGEPILSAQQYSVQAELGSSLTIEADKGI